MTDNEALKAITQRQQLPQYIVKRLLSQGLIEASRVTNMDSTEEEFLPTFITEKGRRILEG